MIDTGEIYRNEFTKNSNKNTHFTPYILARVMSDEFDELPDKILYLDVDIIYVIMILKKYLILILTNYEIGASLDAIGRKAINPKYMNSGVILMDLPEIRRTGCFAQGAKALQN